LSPHFFALVDDSIQKVEERMRTSSFGQQHDLQSALDQVISSGGKRVRPTIVLLIGKMLGGDDERTINLAAAIELLHTATLVHDDLIDGSLLRRGNPTLNTHWSPAATVLAGDYIFARAAELAAAAGNLTVMRIFAQTLSTIVAGEINQLFTSKGLVSRDDYFKRIYAKTASLFETAGHTAAIIGGNHSKAIQSMKTYGYEIGMAFQIMDDILDFTGEQTRVGKPVASDLRQGLVTLPAIHYLEMEPGDPDMQAVLDQSNGDEGTINRLIMHIRASGAIQQARVEAQAFVDRAIQSLADMPSCKERRALIDMAGYVLKREV